MRKSPRPKILPFCIKTFLKGKKLYKKKSKDSDLRPKKNRKPCHKNQPDSVKNTLKNCRNFSPVFIEKNLQRSNFCKRPNTQKTIFKTRNKSFSCIKTNSMNFRAPLNIKGKFLNRKKINLPFKLITSRTRFHSIKNKSLISQKLQLSTILRTESPKYLTKDSRTKTLNLKGKFPSRKGKIIPKCVQAIFTVPLKVFHKNPVFTAASTSQLSK